MLKYAVAVSGGVDSLCALLLIKKAGYSPLAIHGIFNANHSVPHGLAQCCKKADIELILVDLHKQFKERVIDYFISEYAQGRTPNPCAICNKFIKFDALYNAALDSGAEKFATGHYATIVRDFYSNPVFGKCADSAKDQGYFLSLIQRGVLGKIEFPLAKYSKSQVKAIVKESGYTPPLTEESQDACFLKDLSSQHGLPFREGRIVLRTAATLHTDLNQLPVIGSHTGLYKYTIGQRKGLHIPWHEPLYIREINQANNTLVLSPHALIQISAATIEQINWFVSLENWPSQLYARLRYGQGKIPITLDFSENEFKILLNTPCFATAPGQIAVIYDSYGHILAAGHIKEILFAPNPTS